MKRKKEVENMEFSMVDAMYIDKILQQKGIERGLRMFSPDFRIFTKEQLEQIDEIIVQGATDISFLEYFPNLKHLIIRSHEYSRVIGEGNYEDSDYFNQITDFSVIKKIKSLEELCIENDICIKELDVRGLDKLRIVHLINNPRLESIVGLSEQHHLDHVVMYGNNVTNFPNIVDYLYNTLDAKENILDISIFFTAVKSVANARTLYEMDLMGLCKATFAEKNGLVNYIELTMEQITTLYVKFRRLFEQKGLIEESDFQKIGYVFRYVVDYIKFANDELQEREKFYHQILGTYQEVPEFYKKRLGSLHNSFNTYHFKRGNCEGIVNLMRFLLSVLDIPTENVHCHDKRCMAFMELNHAILRAKCDGVWRYYDTTYNRKNVVQFYEKTFEEMSEYVDMSVFEKMISKEDEYGFGEFNGEFVKK